MIRIFVYDLGLSKIFRKELETIEGVTVITLPPFVSFWRSCYTWKSYIFCNPFAELNFYLDAGTQVLRSLDEIFSIINKDGYIAVSQGVSNKEIIPVDYIETFKADPAILNESSVTAGVFGFKKDGSVSNQLSSMHEASKQGYCLGFSKGDQWRNKGVNKTDIVRSCEKFRHDTTLLNIFLRKDNPNFYAHDGTKYAGWNTPQDHPNQLIWNMRMNYTHLQYLPIRYTHKKFSLLAIVNRTIIYVFILLKRMRLVIKGK